MTWQGISLLSLVAARIGADAGPYEVEAVYDKIKTSDDQFPGSTIELLRYIDQKVVDYYASS